MENRLYPTWEQLEEQHNPLTDGERALLKYLDEHLPRDPKWKQGDKLSAYDGWLIFGQPYFAGSRPDVVIFNPQVGIVIYEVKDWNLEHYAFKNDKLYVHDGRGAYGVKSPVSQVAHYRDKLVGQLVPALGEAMDKDQDNFALIRTALYFHRSTTAECQDKFSGKVKLKHFPVFGQDAFVKEKLYEIVPDLSLNRSRRWRSAWNEDVLFWLKPPYHSLEQATLLKLKAGQQKVAEPMPGHHRVRGVAGSGKTQALAYRASKLASEGKNVLVVTFNITLWHYIKDMIARSPFNFDWNQITFTHFHGFCKDQLNAAGKSWPADHTTEHMSREERERALEVVFRNTVPEAVIDAIQDREYMRYDAILIDEGQDYYYEWYAMLNEHFMTTRDEMLIVCDKRQNIFERELDWLDKRVTRKGLEKFKDPYIDLTVTFRLPANVAVMTNEFSELFGLNQELKVGPLEKNPVLLHSQHIVWRNIESADWKDNIQDAFKRMKREEYSASDMVILLPSHALGMEAVKLFEDQGIQVNHVFDSPEEETAIEKVATNSARKKQRHFKSHKRAFWMGDGRLKMSTIHSFKGWELLNIVLFIPDHYVESTAQLDSIVYTAMTRTRENLIVLNANARYKEFGEKLPKHWHKQ
ncbi:MAG: UvrD-helicase domain-containing protein [Flavobacteriales bacterium]